MIPYQAFNVEAQTLNNVVVCVNECSIFSQASTDADVLETFSFGQELNLNSQEKFISGDLTFYQVKIESGVGYVLANAVLFKSHALKKELDPNAKILNEKTPVYTSQQNKEENILIINGENVLLKQYQEVKIIDGYNENKAFSEIMFEIDGTIYSGFVETKNLVVEGFNPTIILVIFIFLLVASIILSIVLSTRKKRKKSKAKIK